MHPAAQLTVASFFAGLSIALMPDTLRLPVALAWFCWVGLGCP